VELRDFGVFAVKTPEARSGPNPRNGAEVAVSEKVVGCSRSTATCTAGSMRLRAKCGRYAPEPTCCPLVPIPNRASLCRAVQLGYVLRRSSQVDPHQKQAGENPRRKRDHLASEVGSAQ
jgi:hypothetical protein